MSSSSAKHAALVTTHHLTAALPGTRCWCGRPALVTRSAPDVTSHYCRRHWVLWLQYVTQDLHHMPTSALTITLPTPLRGEPHASSPMATALG